MGRHGLSIHTTLARVSEQKMFRTFLFHFFLSEKYFLENKKFRPRYLLSLPIAEDRMIGAAAGKLNRFKDFRTDRQTDAHLQIAAPFGSETNPLRYAPRGKTVRFY
jgi:hypothetical protein